MDISALILAAIDKPDWVHALLKILLEKKLRFIESMRGARFDLIETGGGSASSTLISPRMHEEFCLPYDRTMHDALHDLGFKVVYHTCGGTFGHRGPDRPQRGRRLGDAGPGLDRRQPGALGVQAQDRAAGWP